MLKVIGIVVLILFVIGLYVNGNGKTKYIQPVITVAGHVLKDVGAGTKVLFAKTAETAKTFASKI